LLIVNHFRRTVFHAHLIQLSRYATHRGFFAKKFPHTSFRISYFIPSSFLIYLLSLLGVFFLAPKYLGYFGIPLYLYILFFVVDAFKIYSKSGSSGATLLAIIGIFLSNITYGFFFLKGLISKPDLILREVDILNEKYIKG